MVPELPPTPSTRRIFVNRTLNLRSIEAIGFDMDYTLVHYRHEAWERAAYRHVRQRLLDMGWPVPDLEFDLHLAQLGLVIDLELGNVVKANRFGYVTRASHGTRRLDFGEQRSVYSRVLVDLAESTRWYFLHTLFALSEACLFMQLVDLLDAGKLPNAMGYADLHRLVRRELDATHMEGTLKAEIIAELRQRLWPLIAEGAVKPVVSAEIPITNAAEAHRLLDSNETVGKVVLTLPEG